MENLGGNITPKGDRFSKEDLLAVAVFLAFFILNVRIMSGNGLLPGNDPGVHLGHIYEILASGRVSFQEFSLTLPLFHVLGAVLIDLAGAVDLFQIAFLLKILVSFISAFGALGIYMFCRGPFGKPAALFSSIFLSLSVPLMELISWGGYTNIVALLYITFLFYLLISRHEIAVKFLLIGLMAFTLFLLHYLSAFVFALMFAPIFFIEVFKSRKEGKNILIPFVILICLIIAAGVWYLAILLPYIGIAVYHLFLEMEVYTYTISFVSFDYFLKSFGVSLFLTAIGVPIAFILTIHAKKLSVFALLMIWVAVPIMLSQSYLFGIYLLYPRFLYYVAVPIAILSGVAVYGMTRVLSLAVQKLGSVRIKKPATIKKLTSICLLVTVFVPLTFQFVRAYPEIGSMPSYYSVCPLSGYNVGNWLKTYSSPDAVIVASDPPGSWIKITTQREAMEEISPIFGRSKIADTVLNLRYEMENFHTLVRRQTPGGYVPSVDLYASVLDLWQMVLRIPDDGIYVRYEEESGRKIDVTMLNCVNNNIYWAEKSLNETLLVLENSFGSFTLQRVIAMRKIGRPVEITWQLIAHEKMRNVELRIDASTNPSLHLDKASVPGVLQWSNPWDNPSLFDQNGEWAVVERFANESVIDHVALLDSEIGLLTVLNYDSIPNWVNVGALGNQLIDAVRVSYKLGNIGVGENNTVHSSIVTQVLDSKPYELSDDSLRKLLVSKVNWGIYSRDYSAYIKDYNIGFVVGDPRFISPDFSTSPLFNKVYDNDRFVIFATKRNS